MREFKSGRKMVSNSEFVRILNISTVAATGIADGKMLPVLFLDTSDRKDVENAIKNHGSESQGDVDIAWAINGKYNINQMALKVELIRPIHCCFHILFDLKLHAPVVDMIIQNQACIIVSASDGLRFYDVMDTPRLMVEVMSENVQEDWERIYLKASIKRFREEGVSKKKAKLMAEDFIKEMRSMAFRF